MSSLECAGRLEAAMQVKRDEERILDCPFDIRLFSVKCVGGSSISVDKINERRAPWMAWARPTP